MKRLSLADVRCSIAQTLEIIGDWWTPLILRDLLIGMERFEDIRRDLGIASNILSARLDHLSSHGIVERRGGAAGQTHPVYRLTGKGEDLFGVLMAIMNWGDRWSAGAAGPPVILMHSCCQKPVSAKVTCSECGEILKPASMTAKLGKSARQASGTMLSGEFLAKWNRKGAGRLNSLRRT